MSILQQLADAAFGAYATSASTNSTDRSAATAACTEALKQLSASVAAYQQAIKTAQVPGDSAADPIQAVQEGLISSERQLQQLLQQQGLNTQQYQTSSTLLQSSNPKPSLTVLQALLQLAVGDVCLPKDAALQHQQQEAGLLNNRNDQSNHQATAATPDQQVAAAGDDWDALTAAVAASAALRSAADHHRWVQAACAALECFQLQDIVQLPPSSLAQAVLLQPQLLHKLLEVLTAAVLQPVLSATAAAVQQMPSEVKHCAPPSSSSSVQDVLNQQHPYWQHVPEILAAQPLLLRQASTTLLSWLEQSGHQRLWQITSLLCRPAWQYLAAAAAATTRTEATATQPVQGIQAVASQGTTTMASTPVAAAAGSWQQSGTLSSSRSVSPFNKKLLSGGFRLLCPVAWQQQLVQILVQEPSVVGLQKILPLLPGLQSHAADGTPAIAAAAAALGSSECGGQGNDNIISSTAAWPSLDEWQSACWGSTVDQHDSESVSLADVSNKSAHKASSAAAAAAAESTNLVKVLSGWRLVVQHRCWYQFACYILVNCAAASKGAGGHLDQLQQQQLAAEEAAASHFISWIQEPVHSVRQVQLQQVLMAPWNKQSTAAAAAGQPEGGSSSVLSIYKNLLQSWQQAGSSSKAWSTLLHLDLPIAVLQQQQLQLAYNPQQSLHCCFPTTMSALPEAAPLTTAQQQAELQNTSTEGSSHTATGDANSSSSSSDVTSMILAIIDALDDSSSAVVQLLQAGMQAKAQLAPASPWLPQQQQQQHGDIACSLQQQLMMSCDHWLAKQWVTEVISDPNNSSSSVLDIHRRSGESGTEKYDLGSSAVHVVQVAKRLLLSVSGCDREVKAAMTRHKTQLQQR